jgi:phospholipid/cholesterol/gamma-HCH transport system substrate-binding protein
MRVTKKYQVPLGSEATVVPIGIFGDQAIALTPEGITEESYAAGDTIPIGVPAPGIAELLARMDTIGRNMSDVTQAIEFQLVQGGGLQDLRSTLAATNQLVLRLNAIAAEQARELSLATAALRRAATAVDSATIDSTMKSIRQSGGNLSVLTGELATASASFTSIMAKVDTGGGSLGKLVNDTLLYRDVRMLVLRLDSLTADFKKNPRRYINLEIF